MLQQKYFSSIMKVLIDCSFITYCMWYAYMADKLLFCKIKICKSSDNDRDDDNYINNNIYYNNRKNAHLVSSFFLTPQ